MAIQYPYFFIMKITRNILPNSNMKLDQVCTVKKITWLNRLLLRNIKMRICKMFSWHQKMQFVLCIDATQLALQWGQRLNEVVFYFLKDNIFFSLWNWNKILKSTSFCEIVDIHYGKLETRFHNFFFKNDISIKWIAFACEIALSTWLKQKTSTVLLGL